MIRTEKFETVEISSADALTDWLEAHHAQDESVWLVTWKKGSDKYLSTEDVLDALVAYGWIDGIRRKLDETRTMQLVSKRRVQHWAKSYKDRAQRLIDEGRMAAPGLQSIKEGKASGLWSFMDDVDALILPDDLQAALDAMPEAARYYAEAPPAYRRNLLRWVKLAKTDATREKRIASIVTACAKSERIPQM